MFYCYSLYSPSCICFSNWIHLTNILWFAVWTNKGACSNGYWLLYEAVWCFEGASSGRNKYHAFWCMERHEPRANEASFTSFPSFDANFKFSSCHRCILQVQRLLHPPWVPKRAHSLLVHWRHTHLKTSLWLFLSMESSITK